MADAAVEFLLENLTQLLLYHAHLILDAKNQVEILENDLRLFKAFLKQTTKKQRKDDTLKEIVRQIRDVVYEADDIIDLFVTQAYESKAKTSLIKKPTKLLSIAKDVKAIGDKVKRIQENKLVFTQMQTDAEPESSVEERKDPMVREKNIVGFVDVAETIIKYLTEDTKELDIITVVGMPGLGKTTLAVKNFRDPGIEYEFPTRLWVNVSQEFRKKDVLLDMLRNFTNINDDIHQKTDQQIADILHKYLEKGKFLIVMDDVWSAAAWNELVDAFPKSNSTGKILITSRHKEVGLESNKKREPHMLRFLRQDESWLLFQSKVFGNDECPPELKVLGQIIVEQCKNLPLAIVVIGGTLVKKASYGDMGATITAWRKVSESVKTYLNDPQENRMKKIIALSYDKLPYYLRPCFLYLGMFPEDFEIPVRKLTLMWIAEGFIQQQMGISLEDTAQGYLEDLISRNLLMVEKMSQSGKIKTCKIHDMLREFCINEAGNTNENFFQEIKTTKGRVFEPSLSEVEKFRRLCIHSNVVKFIESKPSGQRVRSLVSKEKVTIEAKNILFIPTAFKLLRVLDSESMKFTKFPNDLTKLVHLRYLVMSSDFKSLPSDISKLWNIQTLIVNTTWHTLDIKADIWNMTQLRHVKTNVITTVPKPGKSSKGEKLQTLGTISHKSCTEDMLDRARSLKKLGIRGRIGDVFKVKGMEKLSSLEKLKLVNDVFPSPPSEGHLPGLPKSYEFPPNLRSLTLSATFLDWSQMSTLGMLDKLEVLKLKDNAFVGKHWEARVGGFRDLELLHIERTDLVIWSASGHDFPKLMCLVLMNCEKLTEIPIGLAESLHKLYLKRTTESAAASARKIEEAKQKKHGQETSRRYQFKLVIAPGDELK